MEEPDEDLSLLQLDRLLRERLQQLRLERDKVMAEMQRLRVRVEAEAFRWRGFMVSEGHCVGALMGLDLEFGRLSVWLLVCFMRGSGICMNTADAVKAYPQLTGPLSVK